MLKWSFIFILISITQSWAQKQVVFIYHGSVVARFTEEEIFHCVLKNGKKKGGAIVELNEFSMITSNDTIAYQSIAKVNAKSMPGGQKKIGTLLAFVGLGYVIIDQVNAALGYGGKGWDQTDWNALIIGGVGVTLLLLKPRYQRLKPGTYIRTIDYKSPYYHYEN